MGIFTINDFSSIFITRMKRLLSFYLSILILSIPLFLKEALPIEPSYKSIKSVSKISSVTVYSDRAMVTRKASLGLDQGNYIISFDDLPIGLIEDSIRVREEGEAIAKITGIEFKKIFLEEAPEERVRRLEDEILSQKDESALIDSQVAVLNSQKAFLESIKVGYAERISKEMAVQKPKTEELGEVLNFLGENLSSIAAEARRLEIKKRELSSKIDALIRKLRQIKGDTRKETRSVIVSIDVLRSGDIRLDLSYAIQGASWNPIYDMRLSEDGKKLEVTYRGLVSQRTGEDWMDVALSLSTARPAIGANPPELPPWYIEILRPPSASSMMEESQSKTEAKALASAPAEKRKEFAMEGVRIEEQGSAVLFHIMKKEDIPADGFPHNTTISIDNFDIKTEYLSVPKLSPFAYLKGEIINKTDYPFLAGKANIFMGANFTGNAFIKNPIAPREKIDLFFGIDEGIKVKREEMKRHKEGGFLGKNRMTYRYRLEVQNFKKELERITLLDQIPVPKDEEIKVKLIEANLKPDEIKEDGTVKWSLNLNPQEKREIIFEFQVEYPKDKEIIGF